MSRLSSSLPEGIALLVAGAGSPGAARDGASAAQALGQIGEALLATGAPWRIRRLSAGAGERYAPDRANLKRFIDELAQPADVAVLVVSAEITTARGEPALVTGDRHDDYPTEATLPLSWVGQKLRACGAERLLLVLSARDAGRRIDAPAPGGAWLEALGTARPSDVVAVDASGEGARTFDALLAGLCGDALDPRTGTVTMRSIGEHLARSVPQIAVQASLASETLAVSPPLGGLWTVRASGVQRAAARPPAADEPHDLIGVVLPGRFQIERALASGTFGTVYRARQLAVQRDVAIKVLHASIDPTSEDGRLFVHEIQSAGRIDHRNVVRIYQADITPTGRLFFAMELLVGRDLQQIAGDEGPLAPERAVALMDQLLAGLGAAHEAGLVHADVKPANAFVVSGREERVVLLDFGLARLRRPGKPAESAGGTPAYMAPEQLHDGRVDARSDLFSAALVLFTLLTGWRRTRAEEIVPPLDRIDDPALRSVLERALAPDPAARFQTAVELADALCGRASTSSSAAAIRPPFRHLAPFTERDRGRLHGRERDIAELTEQVLYRRAVIYTAPSGAGKTSLLRAGLVPHLESLGARPVYLICRAGAGTAAALAAAIRPGATSVAGAIADWHAEHSNRKLVLILDQLEAVLSGDRDEAASPAPGDLVGEALAFDRWPADADVSVVLSVREDFLARVVGGGRRIDEGVPILRLGPLDRDGARAAIAGPLAEQRLSIAPDLLEALLADLESAAGAIGAEMGWGQQAAAYPPHLQLACSVLYEALGPGEATLTLDHYRRLGGLDTIVGEHLDRVLDSELDRSEAAVARDLFLTLVSAAHTRAHRSEAELVDIVGGRHGAEQVTSVLEALRARGLLVRLRAAGGEPSWELVHDSLVPRVLAWIDRRDLDRRRAVEMMRHHLRRSSRDAPSLLGRGELRELRAHPDAVSELETEWSRRSDGGGSPWTPAALVARSRRTLRRRRAVVAALAIVILASTAIIVQRWRSEVRRRMREQVLRDRDMGRFSLELAPFDWDAAANKAVPVRADALPGLTWRIHEVHPEREDDPGMPLPDFLVVRDRPSLSSDGLSRVERVETRGGSGFLVVDGRGRAGETCPPSSVPLRRLPGYARRERADALLRVQVPTCRATRAGMIAIPAGPFIRGGVGEPRSEVLAAANELPERIVHLSRFHIDRTEVTNAAFRRLADMEALTSIKMPSYPDAAEFRGADEPDRPVAGLNWARARAYCRFLGKDLPTTEQWQKAARGGLTLADGSANAMPRRNLPWGELVTPAPARIQHRQVKQGTVAVGSSPGDVSPYGVLDLAGNVQEWTSSTEKGSPGSLITRGGNWFDTTPDILVDMLAIDNLRLEDASYLYLGMRCAMTEK